MARLTAKQREALHMVADADGKSGRYYHDLGASMVTLGRLEMAGLIRARGVRAITSQWTITDLGRALLSERARGDGA